MVKIESSDPASLPSGEVANSEDESASSPPSVRAPVMDGESTSFDVKSPDSSKDALGGVPPGLSGNGALEPASSPGALSPEERGRGAGRDEGGSDSQEQSAPSGPRSVDPEAGGGDAFLQLNPELFSVGEARMSRKDIEMTIKVVTAMETVIITSLDRLEKAEKNREGVPPPELWGRGRKVVPAPEGGSRYIAVRSAGSSESSGREVKARYLSRQERKILLRLAQRLPKVTGDGTSKKTMSEFKTAVLRILMQPTVNLNQVRSLLPIKESGSLGPPFPEGGDKSLVNYERVTSEMLKKKAQELGLMD